VLFESFCCLKDELIRRGQCDVLTISVRSWRQT